MFAVVSHLRLKEPIEPDVFTAAQRELPERIAGIPGLRGLHVLEAAADHLVLLILGDTAESLERLRDEVGNAWMREAIVPHLAVPPERVVARSGVSIDL